MIKNLAGMLKNAKSMQKNIEEAKEKISKTVFSSEANGLTMQMTGGYQLLDINPGPLQDKTEIINAIKQAHTDCIMQIAKTSQDQIQNLSKDLNLDDLLGGN